MQEVFYDMYFSYRMVGVQCPSVFYVILCWIPLVLNPCTLTNVGSLLCQTLGCVSAFNFLPGLNIG
jgi:hypothetical protein